MTDEKRDIVERLRRQRFTREDWHEPYGTIELPCDEGDWGAVGVPVNPDGEEAAAEIERLRAFIVRMGLHGHPSREEPKP